MSDVAEISTEDENAEKEGTKNKKKRGGVWRVVFWVALIVFVVSAGALACLLYSYWSGQNDYDEIAQTAFPDSGSEELTLADMVVDWDALREINPDIVAWAYIPGTVVNYPVAYKEGDNEYYLHHNFSLGEGQFGVEYGSIMLSGENSGDFSDEVNVLYGHHMRNGSMFALLAQFHESDVFNDHRTIYLLTPQGNYRLNTFAVERVHMTYGSIATPNYATDQEFADFKQWLIDESLVAPDPDTTEDALDAEKLFAFSTCDGADNTYRYITFADVAEYVPAEYVGTGTYVGNGTVEKEDVDAVADDAEERAEN